METTTLHELANAQHVLAWIVLMTGILALGFALFFLLVIKYAFFKGLGWAFLLSGLLQIFTAACMLSGDHPLHSPDEAELFTNGFLSTVHLFYRVALACLGAGLLLLFFSLRKNLPFWRGLALGLLIQGALCSALLAIQNAGLKPYKISATQVIGT